MTEEWATVWSAEAALAAVYNHAEDHGNDKEEAVVREKRWQLERVFKSVVREEQLS